MSEPHMHTGIALHADIIGSRLHRVSPHVVCSMTVMQEAYRAIRQTWWQSVLICLSGVVSLRQGCKKWFMFQKGSMKVPDLTLGAAQLVPLDLPARHNHKPSDLHDPLKGSNSLDGCACHWKTVGTCIPIVAVFWVAWAAHKLSC